jgi:hypothetical protein
MSDGWLANILGCPADAAMPAAMTNFAVNFLLEVNISSLLKVR